MKQIATKIMTKEADSKKHANANNPRNFADKIIRINKISEKLLILNKHLKASTMTTNKTM